MPVLFERFDQRTDPVIHNFDHGGVGRHDGCPFAFLGIVECIPGRDSASNLGMFRNDTQLQLAGKAFTLERLKACHIAIETFLNPVGRCLNRRMRRVVCQIEVERPILIDLGLDKFNGGIRERMGQIKVVRIVRVIIDVLTVFHHELRAEIVLRAPPGSVKKVESAVEREQRFLFRFTGKGLMPFPDNAGGIAVRLQDFGDGRSVSRKLPAITGQLLVFRHRAHSDRMRIATSQQRGA